VRRSAEVESRQAYRPVLELKSRRVDIVPRSLSGQGNSSRSGQDRLSIKGMQHQVRRQCGDWPGTVTQAGVPIRQPRWDRGRERDGDNTTCLGQYQVIETVEIAGKVEL